MPRSRVNTRATETPEEAANADRIADNGPKIEDLVGAVPPSESPYRPEVSIDANPDHRARP